MLVKKRASLLRFTPHTPRQLGFALTAKAETTKKALQKNMLSLGLQVIMGGGQKYFDAKMRKDKKDVYANLNLKTIRF